MGLVQDATMIFKSDELGILQWWVGFVCGQQMGWRSGWACLVLMMHWWSSGGPGT